jgi:glycerol-3-phosphate dehydrogenase (NAD(P)+)
MVAVPKQHNASILVVGAGSWGTALANLLASNDRNVTLWSHRSAQVDAMRATHINQDYLPDFQLHSKLKFSDELVDAAKQHDHILFVVPSHAIESVLLQLKDEIQPQGLCWAIKGVEAKSVELISERVQHHFPGVSMAMVTGPSFAKEVMKGLPTAVAIASNDLNYAETWAELFRNDRFRVYCNEELIAAQIAGAMKNVLAIACGIADGLGFGANTRAAVITRGLAEMIRLGVKLGADERAFSGLAGVGDLVLTCTDDLSRNRRFGLLVGAGSSIDEACRQIGQVVEGLHNAKQIQVLAKRFEVELPICKEVALIVEDGKSPQQAVHDLLNRAPGTEDL